MWRWYPIISAMAMIVMCLTACQQPSDKPAAENTPHPEVTRERAIARATDYLFKSRHGDHWISAEDWPESGNQYGGENGLALYAMLKAGQVTNDARLKPDSPELGPCVAWEVHARTTSVYATALKVIVLCNVTSTPDRAGVLSRCTGELIRAMGKDGGYSYTLERKNDQVSDSSNSDYALMAVLAASRRGVQVPDEYWTNTIRFWRTRQNADGGWGYEVPGLHPQSDPAMTAGAVADMATLQGNAPHADAMPKAISYLDHNHDARSSDYYYLFNLKRAGDHMLAGGRIGQAIEEELLRSQFYDGTWRTDHDSFWGKPDKTISTAYALLALTYK